MKAIVVLCALLVSAAFAKEIDGDLPALARALQGTDAAERRKALRAINDAGIAPAILLPFVMNAEQQATGDEREWVVAFLEKMGEARLQGALVDPIPAMRHAASAALYLLAAQPARPARH